MAPGVAARCRAPPPRYSVVRGGPCDWCFEQGSVAVRVERHLSVGAEEGGDGLLAGERIADACRRESDQELVEVDCGWLGAYASRPRKIVRSARVTGAEDVAGCCVADDRVALREGEQHRLLGDSGERPPPEVRRVCGRVGRFLRPFDALDLVLDRDRAGDVVDQRRVVSERQVLVERVEHVARVDRVERARREVQERRRPATEEDPP
jgi:hypothetical protein